MKPTTKGQVEVQFNWIFILIVGAIILAFFVTVALKQKQVSETGTTISFLSSFENALSGISSVQGKQLLYEVPKMDLRYDCTTGCDCAAYIGTRAKAQALIHMDDKIIFSPNSLKGNNLLTWSKEWSYPFKITNFILITSPEVKYLIENNLRGTQIFDGLPPVFIEKDQTEQKAFDKQLFNTEDASIPGIAGNYKIKFVFTVGDVALFKIPDEIQSLTSTDVTAIKITKAESGEELVEFYQKDTTDKSKFKLIGTSYLFGDATVYAAIFAEDLNAYACMMNRAFKSFNTVSKVYREKQSVYFNDVYLNNARQTCKINYVSDVSTGQLVQNSANFDFKLPGQEASLIVTNTKAFAIQNDNAIKDSCPHIY